MACTDKRYQKSAQQTYNTASQAYVATGTALTLLGTQCTNCGCSISTQAGSMQINNTGLYYLAADVISTPTAAGAQVLQLYNNGVAMPCATRTDTTVSGSTITQHVETVIPMSACCAVSPTITVRISGVAGTVSYVKMTALRLA